jgi:hypothetical protein
MFTASTEVFSPLNENENQIFKQCCRSMTFCIRGSMPLDKWIRIRMRIRILIFSSLTLKMTTRNK